MPDLLGTWMGDFLWSDKPSWYVTSHWVNSAFYPPWDGKTSVGFWTEL